MANLREYGRPGAGISAVARKGTHQYRTGVQAELAVAELIRNTLKGSGAIVVHDAPTPTPPGTKRYKANADHVIVTAGPFNRPQGLIVETKGWASGYYLAKWGGWRWTARDKGKFAPADTKTIRLLLDRYRTVLPGIQWSAVMVTTRKCHVLGATGYRQQSMSRFAGTLRKLRKSDVPDRVQSDILAACKHPAPLTRR